MLIRIIAVGVAVLTTVGCDQRAAFERLIPKDDTTFAINVFAKLRNHEYGPIEALLDTSTLGSATRPQLEQMSATFGNDAPEDVHVIGVFSNTVNGATTYVRLTLEYRFPQRWLLAAMSLHRRDGARTIDAMRVQPAADSQEHLNQFTLAGKGIGHYAMLVSASLVPLFIVGTLVALWRAPMVRRKWLWGLFIAVGVGQLTFNWTTGAMGIQLLQVALLGGGFAKAGPYGPVSLAVAFPLGAITFLIRRHGFANTPLQPRTGAASR